MQRFAFSSDELPAGLDDRARFLHWRDLYSSLYGAADMLQSEDLPFSARMNAALFGTVAVSRIDMTVDEMSRRSNDPARDDIYFGMNRGPTDATIHQQGREGMLQPGSLTLLAVSEPVRLVAHKGFSGDVVAIPRSRLIERVPGAEDLIAVSFGAGEPVTRYLFRYIDFLLHLDEPVDPAVAGHIETTLLDLTELILGSERESTRVARARGLRAVRLQDILAEIQAGYCDATFSARTVARKVGVSASYVQKILYETGVTFTERVTELRLNRAREMLSDPRHDRLKVIDIALECGFGDVSYFNRCFRQRFGASPVHFRGRNGAG
jgi:AraC-like DNA-binding protein